jgi:hypothetical protein
MWWFACTAGVTNSGTACVDCYSLDSGEYGSPGSAEARRELLLSLNHKFRQKDGWGQGLGVAKVKLPVLR